MNKVLVFSLIILFACNSPEQSDGTRSEGVMTRTGVVDISPDEMADKMSEGNIEVIDVRTGSEAASGMIGKARLINYNSPDFEDRVQILSREKTYIVYCAGGGRSRKAAEFLHKSGHSTVYNLKGGIKSWLAAGKEVNRP